MREEGHDREEALIERGLNRAFTVCFKDTKNDLYLKGQGHVM